MYFDGTKQKGNKYRFAVGKIKAEYECVKRYTNMVLWSKEKT
jgi:hypothetical protein